MKNRFKQLALTALLCSGTLFINFQIHENYTGEWRFEAPKAPEGSTKGNIRIKSDAVIMSFDRLLEYPSTWVKMRNDSLIYQTEFDEATVLFSLKIVDKENMTGNAVWKDGETPVTFKRMIKGVRL